MTKDGRLLRKRPTELLFYYCYKERGGNELFLGCGMKEALKLRVRLLSKSTKLEN